MTPGIISKQIVVERLYWIERMVASWIKNHPEMVDETL